MEDFDRDYTPPEAVHPLMAGLLTTMHERHVDMRDLVRDLPPDALVWTPGPQTSALSGLVRHVMDVWVSTVRVAASELPAWHGENGALLDATDDAPALVACIAAGDALSKRLLPALTDARLREPWPGSDDRSIGMALIEESDHSTLHYGHMQITRHLYEQTYPAFVSGYNHWR